MDFFDSRYWRDAELVGIQFTDNHFSQRQIRAHRHGGYTLSVSDTDLSVRTSGGVTAVAAGSLLRIAPHVWHAVEARTTPWHERAMYCSDAVARCIGIQEPALQHAQQQEPAVVVLPAEPFGQELLECHTLLQQVALHDGQSSDDACARALLRGRLGRWIPIRDEESGTEAPVAGLARSEDAKINKLYELIASGFHERLTLEGLADAVGWHPVHLQRRFRSACGFSPHELLVGHRIEYARDLIAGGARVTYAAHAAGFSDQSHLHKTFISTYAVVPGEYRRLSALDLLQPPSARNGIVD